MTKLILAPNLVLPWSSEAEDSKRYWKTFFSLFIPFVILGYVVASIELPEKTREERAKLPPQLARVVLEKKELPKPPPPKPKPKPKPKEEPKEKLKEEPKKIPKEEPKPKKKEEPKPVPKKAPDPEKLKKAQETAQRSGVLQFADDLSAMRESLDVSDIKTQQVTRAQGIAATANRKLIDSGAQTMSGGVNNAALSTDTGGQALSGRETTAVDSKLAEASKRVDEQISESAVGREKTSRNKASMGQVMDAHKGAIHSLHQRALDEDPTLEGKVVFELIIEPNGVVSSVKIVSSDLDDKRLERKIKARLRAINFGTADVLQTTLRYTFDFLPY
ncbi:AgmX/PglI C-terminal domain-containing protein [Marinagarivorans algicola]|uniref:AgmX/PglI C-terminal domain-containing protein n=1 Tax=Marinagarivorans algicola TaxID=1513270 RepID=UPI0006B636F6|nr:AgmX/PglI C-terminal domain-containing protein [Marinagarivorans algicola]